MDDRVKNISSDTLVRGLMFDGSVKFVAISAKTMVANALKTHGLSRVCTAALGRTIMQAAMMSTGLKAKDDRLTCIINGGGPAGNIVCTAKPEGVVKGYIENPTLELPPTPKGKLDVSTAVGWFGDLTIIRDLALREPYMGKTKLVSGEIAEDFAYYYVQSEQQPCLVYLGVHVETMSGSVLSAGGMMISPLPNCSDEIIDKLTREAQSIETLAKNLETMPLDDCLNSIFDGIPFEISEAIEPRYECDCSKERLIQVLYSLGKDEIADMIATDGKAEMNCRFCNTTYSFSKQELQAIHDEIVSNAKTTNEGDANGDSGTV